MNKFTSKLLLVMAMVTTVIVLVAAPPLASAGNADYVYTLSNGNATITDYNGLDAVITIPSSLDGYPVTAIGASAFISCGSLTSVTIPSTITTIGSAAFRECHNLTSITIPNSVSSVGARAFQGCSSLTDVKLSSRLTRISDYAFINCTSLEYINIPGSVTSIGWETFSGCSSLAEITIPASVISIDTDAFEGCDLLTISGYSGSYAEDYADDNGIPFNELAVNPLTIVSLKSDYSSVYTGTAITWTATASGGSGTKQYRFQIYKDDVLLVDGKYSSARTCRYTPEDPGIYKTQVFVMDDTDTVSLNSSDVQAVQAQLVLTSAKANVASTRVNTEITWTAVATGGSGAKQYRFLLYKDNVLKDTSNYSLTKTFKYTPTEPGVYKVRAYVQDLTGSVAINGMEVKVTAALEITKIQANKTSGKTGSAIIWTVTAKGGEGAKSYRYLIYRDNVLISSSSFLDATTYQYTPTAAGTYRVRAYVRDSLGTVAENSSDIPVEDALTITSVLADKTSCKTGEAIKWTATAKGGQGAKQYRFLLYKDNALITSSNYASSNTYTYTPTEAGVYRVRAYAKDSTATVAVNSKSITVETALVITDIAVSKTVASSSTSITWTVSATGGKGARQYRFLLYKDGSLLDSRNFFSTNTYKYTISQPGTYKVRAYVKDSTGTISKMSKETVIESTVSISSVTADKTSVKVGSPITWTTTATGGEGTKQYRFLLYKDNVLQSTSAFSSSNTFTYTPAKVGLYKVRAYVKDTTGTVAMNSKNIQATAATKGASGAPGVLTLLSVTADKTSIKASSPVTWTVKAVGGEGARQHRFLLYKDNVLQFKTTFSSSGKFTYTLAKAGVYKVRAYVKDTTGTVAMNSKNIQAQ